MSLFNKTVCLQLAVALKQRPRHQYFPVKLRDCKIANFVENLLTASSKVVTA